MHVEKYRSVGCKSRVLQNEIAQHRHLQPPQNQMISVCQTCICTITQEVLGSKSIVGLSLDLVARFLLDLAPFSFRIHWIGARSLASVSKRSQCRHCIRTRRDVATVEDGVRPVGVVQARIRSCLQTADQQTDFQRRRSGDNAPCPSTVAMIGLLRTRVGPWYQGLQRSSIQLVGRRRYRPLER